MRINKEQRQKGHTCQNKIRTSISQEWHWLLNRPKMRYVPTVLSRERGPASQFQWTRERHVPAWRQHSIGGAAGPKRVAGLQRDNWHLGIAHRSSGHRRHFSGGYERCFSGTANPKPIAGLQRDNWYLGVARRCCGYWRHVFSGYERRISCAADPKRIASL
jgi:hypothetical protein